MMPDHLAEEDAPARETLDALLAVVQTGHLVRKLLLVEYCHVGGLFWLAHGNYSTVSLRPGEEE